MIRQRDFEYGCLSSRAGTHTGGREPRDVLRRMWRKSYLGLAAIGFFTIIFNILRLATAVYALNGP